MLQVYVLCFLDYEILIKTSFASLLENRPPHSVKHLEPKALKIHVHRFPFSVDPYS